MTEQKTCEDRVDEQLESTLEDLRGIYPDDIDQLCEYGLCFDYVEPDTFEDQPYGYWRYQLSWGGPSSEFRLLGGGVLQFWFLDWYDGAHRNLQGEDLQFMREVFDWFLECQRKSTRFLIFLYNPKLSLKRIDISEGYVILYVQSLVRAKKYLAGTFRVLQDRVRDDRMWVETKEGLVGVWIKEWKE